MAPGRLSASGGTAAPPVGQQRRVEVAVLLKAFRHVLDDEAQRLRCAAVDRLPETLMESLGEFEWSELHDGYRYAVEEPVAAKQGGRALREPSEVPIGANRRHP